jgi:hypothetical protein
VDSTTRGALRAGAAALQRAAWEEARAHFEAALAESETLEALSGLGAAARGLLDEEAAVSAHERGYRIARERGDDRAAAHLALELVIDCMGFHGMAAAPAMDAFVDVYESWLRQAAAASVPARKT